MKAKTEAPVDIRVWCEQCRIRIAPNEERKMNRGKAYHQRCFPKAAAAGKSKS